MLAGIVKLLNLVKFFSTEHCAESKFIETLTRQFLAEEHCAGRDANPCKQHQTQSNMEQGAIFSLG